MKVVIATIVVLCSVLTATPAVAADRPAAVAGMPVLSAATVPVGVSAAAAAAAAAAVPSARAAAAGRLAVPAAVAARPVVPAAAMLQPGDLGGVTPSVVDDETFAALRPPQPCDATPSAVPRRADRTVSALLDVDGRPTVLMEDVAIYPAGHARTYLRELRHAARTCPDWTILASRTNRLLLKHREYIDYAGTWKTTYLMVARTGRVVVVLADTGWETGNGHRSLVRRLTGIAVHRAAAAA